MRVYFIKIKYYKIIFNINMVVTPGRPNIAATPIDSKLTGIKTPVNVLLIFTAISEKIPINIFNIVFLIGCLERISTCINTRQIKIPKEIKSIDF